MLLPQLSFDQDICKLKILNIDDNFSWKKNYFSSKLK
jgi:hypothetical protein